MKEFFLLVSFFIFCFSNAFSLNRDYNHLCDEDERYINFYEPYCLNHTPCRLPTSISNNLFNEIPKLHTTCSKCSHNSIYLGYLDPDFRLYLNHLKQQLEYSKKHGSCKCLWPEYSEKAQEISNYAYRLFREVLSTTALSEWLENESKQREYFKNPGWFLNKHGVTLALIVQQFRYSDYYHLCKDLEDYSTRNFKPRDALKIKEKLAIILKLLSPRFSNLYKKCYLNHPNRTIKKEIEFMQLINKKTEKKNTAIFAEDFLEEENSESFVQFGEESEVLSFFKENAKKLPEDDSNAGSSTRMTPNNTIEFVNLKEDFHQDVDVLSQLELKNIDNFNVSTLQSLDNDEMQEIKEVSLNIDNFNELETTNKSVVLNEQYSRSFSLQSEILLEKGTLMNGLLLYHEAIKLLTQSIKHNPKNKDAYIERAYAYFELNKIDLALKDYEIAKKLHTSPPFLQGNTYAFYSSRSYIPEHKIDFAAGLIKGILKGSKEAAIDFIPSVFSSLRGMCRGLWAFVCSPREVGEDVINSAYALAEYVSLHTSLECLEYVVPEIGELSKQWKKLKDHSRGKKIGFIIGKYGVEIFAPLGAIKGVTYVSKINALKRANTMATLENCAISSSRKTKILKEASKNNNLRVSALENAAKSNKIIPRNPNVCPHIMQKKHAWHKLIEITGNEAKDFEKVLALLQENAIFSEQNFITSRKFLDGKIIRKDYKMAINGYSVEAIAEIVVEENIIYLKDAWVIQ